MRAVIQRVKQASVTVDGQCISQIGRGILCLVGIGANDTEYESQWLAAKLLALKVFPEDKEGESWGWKKSVVEADYEILCVSQFTLQANLRKGAKPDFHGAKASSHFLQDLRTKYKTERIKDGQFQAMMDVQLVNDGPVTLILDSATDAPAKPVPKQPATAEQKQKAQAKLAARAAAREARLAVSADGSSAEAGGAATPATNGGVNGQERKASTVARAKSEEKLISEAEQKSRDLAERFKVAMTESYP
ncbi:enoyl-CoA hydratase/carnithine racemase [Rhodotorula toruloides]|uniref:D-aminoacyl-tRNA deacylase n=1 Tax=Rhodotorula toruloides TaxID=5286 RepID=A0A511KP86_RHOTO|nr:enoyl-CoA hydratase/carnithine racemase [Rhodotorula toruloides]